MSSSARMTAGTQDDVSRRSTTRMLSDAIAAATARATPIANAAARRIVLLAIGKDRAPRLAQRRRAKNHQLHGQNPAHGHTRTTHCHGPRPEAGYGSRRDRPVG